MNSTKVLFLSEEIPFRQKCGQHVKICNVIKCLSELFDLSCVFLGNIDEATKNDCINMGINPHNCFFLETTLHKNAIAEKLSINLRKIYLNKSIREEVSNLINKVKPDIAWLEYAYLGKYISFFKQNNIPAVYVSHNAQAYLYFLGWKAEEAIIKKILKLPFLMTNYLHEYLFFRKADRLVFISEEDRKYYSRYIKNKKSAILPNFYIEQAIAELKPFETSKEYVCMVGNFNSFQNYSGALFFLNEIWPLIKEKQRDIYLYLIGKLPSVGTKKYNELKNLAKNLPDVILTGEVDDTIPYVKGSIASLVPILHGSGTRTKIVESVACKTPVISTTIGAEGLPFVDNKSILICDTPALFAEKTSDLIQDKKLRENITSESYDIFEKQLGYEVNKLQIKSIVEKTLFHR